MKADLIGQRSARKLASKGHSAVGHRIPLVQPGHSSPQIPAIFATTTRTTKVAARIVNKQRVQHLAWFSTNNADTTRPHGDNETSRIEEADAHVTKEDLSAMEQQTKDFLNETTFPVGSYDIKTMGQARQLIWDWSKLQTPDSVKHSMDLLDRLVQEEDSNFEAGSDEHVAELLNSSLLTSIARNWSICWRENNELISPQAFLEKLESWSQDYPPLAPETRTMHFIMTAAVSKVETKDDALYVESLLQWMKDKYESGNSRIAPTINEYNVLLNALAKSRQPERAEEILCKLFDDYGDGISNIRPDAVSFGTVLYAWKHATLKHGGERAEVVLDNMIQLGKTDDIEGLARPDLQCYFSVLYCWCATQTKHGLEQAERFLQRMHDEYKAGNEAVRPSDSFYGLVIHSWSKFGGGEEGERVLKWMYNDYEQNGNLEAKPTSYHFNPVISCWCRRGGQKNVARAFSLFESMKSLQINPDRATYGALVVGLSRLKERNAGEQAEKLLREQLERYRSGDESCKPDPMVYNSVMHCYSLEGNAMKAMALLQELLQLHKGGTVKITDDRPFCTALAALSRSRKANKVDLAETIDEELKQLAEAGVLDFQPSANYFRTLQGCWASAERPNSGEKCLRALREMQERYSKGEVWMRPTETNYKIVIDAFARIGNPHRAEEVWIEMLQSSLENSAATPGNDSCKAVLASWLKSVAPDAIDRVLDLLDKIAEIDSTGSMDLKLDDDTYYLLFDLCVKSNVRHITAGAESILRKIDQICKQGRGAMGPDSRCYNVTMNCLGRVDNAERSEALFWEMFHESVGDGNDNLRIDAISVSTVLMAWSRSSNPNATRRAEVFFERIEKLVSEGKLKGVELDIVCYASLLQCLANARTTEATEKAEAILISLQERCIAGDRSLRPTIPCYIALVKCRVRVGNVEGAESLIFAMNELHKKGDKHLEPNRQICRIVLAGWLWEVDDDSAPERAEAFLHWMSKSLKGTEQPEDHASLIRCWARFRRPDSGVRAEKVLQAMQKRFGNRKIVRECFADVVCAFARANDVAKAEGLLFRLCDDYLNDRTDLQPELRAFVAVLAAISRTNPANAEAKCLRLVQLLRDISRSNGGNISNQPNRVLDGWNQSFGNDKDSLATFLSTMENLDTSDRTFTAPGSSEEMALESLNIALKF